MGLRHRENSQDKEKEITFRKSRNELWLALVYCFRMFQSWLFFVAFSFSEPNGHGPLSTIQSSESAKAHKTISPVCPVCLSVQTFNYFRRDGYILFFIFYFSVGQTDETKLKIESGREACMCKLYDDGSSCMQLFTRLIFFLACTT